MDGDDAVALYQAVAVGRKRAVVDPGTAKLASYVPAGTMSGLRVVSLSIFLVVRHPNS